MSNLEGQIGEERERGKAADAKLVRLTKEIRQKEEERTAAEEAVAERAARAQAAEERIRGLEAQAEEQGDRVGDQLLSKFSKFAVAVV